MTLFRRINTITKPFIKNSVFRYSHHHSFTEIYVNHNTTAYIPKKNFIINLLGDRKSVDEASWEIKSFAQEKSLNTSNIVYNNDMLLDIIYKNNYLQFIVNRCYNMSCDKLLYLNQDIVNSDRNWIPYNLYVMPEATNRFNTCDFIRYCNTANIIVYPLAATEENKRRDINILIN